MRPTYDPAENLLTLNLSTTCPLDGPRGRELLREIINQQAEDADSGKLERYITSGLWKIMHDGSSVDGTSLKGANPNVKIILDEGVSLPKIDFSSISGLHRLRELTFEHSSPFSILDQRQSAWDKKLTRIGTTLPSDQSLTATSQLPRIPDVVLAD
jgi:hypothetical protein